MRDFETMFGAFVDQRIDERLAERERQQQQRQAAGEMLLTMAQVAAKLGSNRRALAEKFRRLRKLETPHPLDLIAVDEQGARRFRAADVDAYIKSAPQKRAVGGAR